MEKKELFLDKIQIDETFSMQIDLESFEFVNIYENDVIIDQFSLKRRIYTFFKVIQSYTNSDITITDKEKKISLYGEEIHIKDQVYMKVSDEHKNLVVEFYHKENNEKSDILYLTRMNYNTQKLFHMMLIPKKVINDPMFKIMNPNEFKDLMDILSVIKI